MPSKRPRTPRAAPWLNWLLRHSLGCFLKRYFRIGASWTEEARSIKPPFVLLANHVTLIDAFILSSFIPAPICWITADGNMRSSLMRFLLGLVGSIPKSKAIPDIETVGQTVRVIRKGRGIVGICPEGQTSWNGITQELVPSTAKLLKLLRVPALAAVIKGGYYSDPRWSSSLRRGRIEIEFSAAFLPAQLGEMDADAIAERLDEVLAHDEGEWNARRRAAFATARRAEGLELALFACPSCGSVGHMVGKGARIGCGSCGASYGVDRRYRLVRESGSGPSFSSIKEWDAWQGSAFERIVLDSARDRPLDALLSDEGVVLERGRRLRPQFRVAKGRLLLYPDRIVMDRGARGAIAFALADLDGVGVLKKRLLEFSVGRDLYRARMPKPSVSARKWHLAMEALMRSRGWLRRTGTPREGV
jgi:1-acyl-sn-glycerol-3-phosphate acyltransferase